MIRDIGTLLLAVPFLAVPLLALLIGCQRAPQAQGPSPADSATPSGAPVSTSTMAPLRTSTPSLQHTATETPANRTPDAQLDEAAQELPTPSRTPMTAPPLDTVEAFITVLQEAFEGDIDAVRRDLQHLVDRDFVFELYPAGRLNYMEDWQNAIGHLSFSLRPAEPVFFIEGIESYLPEGVTPETLYTGDAPIEAVVYSTGWGQVGTGEALLFLTREEGSLRWAGLTLSYDNFQPLPQLETVAAPPGLVYRLEDEWWRVATDGEAQLLLEHPGPLSLNPNASRALYAETEREAVTLFDLTPNISRTVPISSALMQGSWGISWLDEETAILMIMAPDEGAHQGSIGNLALLNVASGALQVLEPEVSIYARPAPTQNGMIIYDALSEDGRSGVAVWRAGEVTPLALSAFEGYQNFDLFHPVPSADGTRFAGISGGPFDPYPVGYVVVDLTQETAHAVHGYMPVGTDANIPPGIHWHEDGEWLALEPPTDDLVEWGVWVMRADGSEKEFLGPGTTNPVWLPGSEGAGSEGADSEGVQLLFSVPIAGDTRLQKYNLLTGERSWLDVPLGAQPVQLSPAGSP